MVTGVQQTKGVIKLGVASFLILPACLHAASWLPGCIVRGGERTESGWPPLTGRRFVLLGYLASWCRHNYVHEVDGMLGDGGSIYTLGVQVAC